jgi:ABC-type sulfate/molybdate transport systems ATPase subunit
MDLLQVEAISKKDERGFHLEHIGFTQLAHRNIAVAGETGSGKTTLLKIIAGLVQPDEGSVLFRGERVIGPSEKLIPGHKGIVYLSQTFELPHFLRVEQILEYANEWTVEKAQKLFDLCRIGHLFKRRTDQLSGGEKQRIAIARLLIMDPKLFLLDEPFSNMDLSNKSLLKQIIEDISKELGISFIMVSHDPIDTLSWANEILVLKEGRLIEKGGPQQIYTQPVYEYTAGLFGKYNVLSEPAVLMVLRSIKKDIHSGQNNLLPQKVIFRPEDCEILISCLPDVNSIIAIDESSAFSDGQVIKLTGVVSARRFYGHYNEADVKMGDGNTIVARSMHLVCKIGDTVSLKIPITKLRNVLTTV